MVLSVAESVRDFESSQGGWLTVASCASMAIDRGDSRTMTNHSARSLEKRLDV